MSEKRLEKWTKEREEENRRVDSLRGYSRGFGEQMDETEGGTSEKE